MTRRVRAVPALLAVAAAVAVMVSLSLSQWDRARAPGRLLDCTYTG